MGRFKRMAQRLACWAKNVLILCRSSFFTLSGTKAEKEKKKKRARWNHRSFMQIISNTDSPQLTTHHSLIKVTMDLPRATYDQIFKFQQPDHTLWSCDRILSVCPHFQLFNCNLLWFLLDIVTSGFRQKKKSPLGSLNSCISHSVTAKKV